MIGLRRAVLLAAAIQLAAGCADVQVQIGESEILVNFRQITLEEQRSFPTLKDSGRAVYVEDNPNAPLFLFHHSNSDGMARWKISKVLSTDGTVADGGADTIAYLNSWAVTPFGTLSANGQDKNKWMLGGGFGGGDVNVQVTCQSADTSLYFDTRSVLRTDLTGIYVQRFMSSDKPLWAQVKEHSRDRPMYLFPLSHPVGCEGSACTRTTWMLGGEYGVDAGLGNAPGIFGAAFPPVDASWEVVSPFPEDSDAWIRDRNAVMYSCSTLFSNGDGRMVLPTDEFSPDTFNFSDVLELVRFVHSIRTVPAGNPFPF
jgi:hypothetical protein